MNKSVNKLTKLESKSSFHGYLKNVFYFSIFYKWKRHRFRGMTPSCSIILGLSGCGGMYLKMSLASSIPHSFAWYLRDGLIQMWRYEGEGFGNIWYGLRQL